MTASAPFTTSAETTHARDIASGLIEACHDCEHAFSASARRVAKPILRAELVQYSIQRQEFVVELHQAIRSLGEEAGDHGHAPEAAENRCRALTRALAEADRAAVIEACQQCDAIALEAYREAMHAGLPYAVSSLLHTHFYALTRVRSRLQSLADIARGNSPIDNDGH
jgi:uncharacterized protein (TIGR02284 family)